MVAAVAPAGTGTRAKMAHEKMLATAARPGESHPARHRGEEALADARDEQDPAMKTKRGTAMKEKLVALVQAIDSHHAHAHLSSP